MARMVAIKPGHIQNCTYCKASGNKTQATWRATWMIQTACDEHKPSLAEDVKRANTGGEGAYYSEADYQLQRKYGI